MQDGCSGTGRPNFVTIPFDQTRTSPSNGKQVELQGRQKKPANHFSQHEILYAFFFAEIVQRELFIVVVRKQWIF